MSISDGGAAFKLAYQISPIIFTGGIAGAIPGAILPVLAFSQAASFVNGLLSGNAGSLNEDDYLCYFQPLPGGTLIEQDIAMYPFANQSVAANAVIQQPLQISMLMICPAGAGGGYLTRLAAMTALQASFDQHNKMGGTYTILTPSFAYTDCVMTSMSDVSNASTKQVQNSYKLDFLKPLISLADAQAAQNGLMSKISGGLPTDGSLTGPGALVNTTSGSAGPTVLPVTGQGAAGISNLSIIGHQ